MLEPAVESLPPEWYEGRLEGRPLIAYRSNGPLLLQVDDVWEPFPSAEEAEHELFLRNQ